MPEALITPEQLITEIRNLLEKQGISGQWLLGQIDEVLLSGVEDEIEGLHFYRQPKDVWEILEMYLDVLQTYMVVLPACYERAEQALQDKFEARTVRIVLQSELEPDIMQTQEPQSYSRAELFPGDWRENAKWLAEIRHMIEEVKAQVR